MPAIHSYAYCWFRRLVRCGREGGGRRRGVGEKEEMVDSFDERDSEGRFAASWDSSDT